MLERYFVRPTTIDKIRSSWIAGPIEEYVKWLHDRGYARRNVFCRVPLLRHFGEFARDRGATTNEDLPAHVEAFVEAWVKQHGEGCKDEAARKKVVGVARNSVQQMIRLVVPGFVGIGRSRMPVPFRKQAPGFITYLQDERGVREATVRLYQHHLRHFERYLERIRLDDLGALSPPVLSAFVVQRCPRLSRTSRTSLCVTLRVFLRYLHRERILARDLSRTVESPQAYRLAKIPRSIPWSDVRRVLEAVDRRSPTGKRDYAMLLLLVTYGLRANEAAGLTLEDIDWRAERLQVPTRKAGHSTAFPLSPVVGSAVLEYLQHGRPETNHRHIFLRAVAPQRPIKSAAVVSRACHYLRKAGIDVPRPGSHTLRHTCVQRLIDTDVPLKTIGDYVGHRSPASTEIYTKVAVEALRDVALGDGEDIL